MQYGWVTHIVYVLMTCTVVYTLYSMVYFRDHIKILHIIERILHMISINFMQFMHNYSGLCQQNALFQ